MNKQICKNCELWDDLGDDTGECAELLHRKMCRRLSEYETEANDKCKVDGGFRPREDDGE